VPSPPAAAASRWRSGPPEELAAAASASEPVEAAPPQPVDAAPAADLVTAEAVEPVAAPALPKPKPRRASPPARRQVEPGPQAAPAAVAEAARATGRAGAGAAPDTGSGDATPGGGRPGAAQDYLARLAAWLERHKDYPRAARLRREEGTVLLRFTIDRSGRLLDWRIERGSGHAALDREVAAMIGRADPLPAMPAEMPQARLELTVPVQFRLR
jgi:protein TonB